MTGKMSSSREELHPKISSIKLLSLFNLLVMFLLTKQNP